MKIKIIYEDDDVLVVDKPADSVVFNESTKTDFVGKALIEVLIEKYPELAEVGLPPRYGVVHRLDKDTSGILLVAKSTEALIFLQKQFSAHTFNSIKEMGETSRLARRESERAPQRGGKNSYALEKTLEKRYIALVCGVAKDNTGQIETLIGRSPKDPSKQKVYESGSAPAGARQAITEYKVLEQYSSPPSPRLRKGNKVNEFTLLEVSIKTGRKHQIRCHLAHIHHPIAGDKLYGFKDSPCPEGLTRQFLHASYLKIELPRGEIKEFRSDLPEDLKKVITNIQIKNNIQIYE